MTDGGWEAATWEGSRRDQTRRTLRLNPRQRLEGLQELTETGARLSDAGRRAGEALEGGQVVRLEGCAPTPLAGYLKALGTLRVVGTQADPTALGWWERDTFHLRTRLGHSGLLAFLTDDYVSSPVVAPWNGGSGFYSGHYRSAIRTVEVIEGGSAERFSKLRAVIKASRDILAREGLTSQPKKGGTKERLFVRLRAELPEAALPFLDAAVVLAGQEAYHPPLLGTGGNDGNLDFTVNYLQSLLELFDPGSGAALAPARALLEEALFDRSVPLAGGGAIGQFSPADAGGPNASTSFEGGGRVNPWDYVLMIEGSVLFAAAATRRLEAVGSGAQSYPFGVRSRAAGSGAAAVADEETARGEIWVPLWSGPATLGEVQHLLREGRATVGRRRARDGLDFARAAARLGVSRGIREFQRYAFLQRYGRTYLATPLNRVPVRHNPTAGLIDQLERRDWLARFRRLLRVDGAPARLESLSRRLDDALFDLALSGTAGSVQQSLIALGAIMRYLSLSAAARDRCPPVPLLEESWLTAADDGSPEFAIAASLASLHARSDGDPPGRTLPMIVHLAPVAGKGRPGWTEGRAADVVWGPASLEQNLQSVLVRRLLVARREPLPDTPFAGWVTASTADVTAWLQDGLDTRRIQALLQGLALVRLPRRERTTPRRAMPPVPAAYRILKPFFSTRKQLRALGFLKEDETLPFVPEIQRHLAAGRVADAVSAGARSLRVRGFPAPRHLSATRHDGARLLAALMVPLSHADLGSLLDPIRRPTTHRHDLTPKETDDAD